MYTLTLWTSSTDPEDKKRYYELHMRVNRELWGRKYTREQMLRDFNPEGQKMARQAENIVKYEKLYPGKTNRKAKKDRY